MNIAILYDDRIAGTRAMNMFSGLVQQFGREFVFQCDLWRFDVLELPEVFGTAARTGESADLVIVSTRCDRDLPPSVRAWLDKCVAAKAPGSAALVGLLELPRRPSDIPGRTREFLQSAANRGLMDFFLREVDLPRTNSGLTGKDVGDRARASSPVLQGTLRQTRRPRPSMP
jgi:hypothetical protein